MSQFFAAIPEEAFEALREDPNFQAILKGLIDALDDKLENLNTMLMRISPLDDKLAPKIALMQGEAIAYSEIGAYLETIYEKED